MLENSKIVGKIPGRLQERKDFFYWADRFLGIFYLDNIDRIFYLDSIDRIFGKFYLD